MLQAQPTDDKGQARKFLTRKLADRVLKYNPKGFDTLERMLRDDLAALSEPTT
jgi:hypothetical protein